jgi:preprotein translocase subunit YajC
MAETSAPAPAAPAPTTPTAPVTPAAPAAQAANPAVGAPANPPGNQATGGEKSGAGNGTTSVPQREPGPLDKYMPFIFIGGFILIFWLLILRPQQKREKQRQEIIKRLKVGDRVMTGGGIIGEIVELADDEATLRIDPRKDVRMRVKRGVIVGPAGEAASDQALKEQQQQQ